jgi:hypothetical protein
LKNTITLVFTFTLFYSSSFAQIPKSLGAETQAMGGAASSIFTNFAFFNNPAGLAEIKSFSLHASFFNSFSISGLNTSGFNVNIPTKRVNLGLGIQKFGDDLYGENLIGILLAKQKDKVSIGLKASYYQTNISDYLSRNTMFLEFGIIVKPVKKINIGLHAVNLSSARLFFTQSLPFLLKMGFSYFPTNKLRISSDLESDLKTYKSIKTGLEYNFYKKIYLRTGLNSQLKTLHFGFGISHKNISFDYATITNQNLGLSNGFSLGFIMNKK